VTLAYSAQIYVYIHFHDSSPSMRLAHLRLTSLATDRHTKSIKMLLAFLTLPSERGRSIRPMICLQRPSFGLLRECYIIMLTILYRAGITPSNTTTYSLSQIQGTLTAQTGAIPYLGCSQNGTSLSEVWYFHHIKGTVSLVPICCRRHRIDVTSRSNMVTSELSILPPGRLAALRCLFITTNVPLLLSVL